MAGTIVQTGTGAILTLIKANASWKIAPFTSNTTDDVGRVYSDYTLASFTGSTPLSLGFGTIGLSSGFDVLASNGIYQWTASSGLPVTIYGIIVFDSSNTLIFSDYFVTPITLTNVGDAMSYNFTQFGAFDASLC